MSRLRVAGLGAGAVAAIVAGILALVFVLIYLTAFVSTTTAETRGATKQRENNAANGAFRQAVYEDFFNLCASVQSDEASIKNLNDELKGNPSEYRKEQIGTSLTAVKNSRAASINDYNAKAVQKHKAQFRASDLPARLDVATEETQCTV